jgi:hypothetical protein
MSRKRHESVMSSVMNGKDLLLRLHGCQRKLVRQAMRMLDLNDLTGCNFYERRGRTR